MQTQDKERPIQPTESVTRNTGANAAQAPYGGQPLPEEDVYLTACAFCGGQFPTFRAICDECEDVADVDGFRDGKKAVRGRTAAAALRTVPGTQ